MQLEMDFSGDVFQHLTKRKTPSMNGGTRSGGIPYFGIGSIVAKGGS
jgi:hypothetical protein